MKLFVFLLAFFMLLACGVLATPMATGTGAHVGAHRVRRDPGTKGALLGGGIGAALGSKAG